MITKPLDFTHIDPPRGEQLARAFAARMAERRSVRDFSDRPVPRGIIEAAIRTAGSAPSGANLQPWHFVAVSKDDPGLRKKLRDAAEEEERDFYAHRAPREWLDVLAPLGTDPNKPFLEVAPWLVAVFVRPYAVNPDGSVSEALLRGGVGGHRHGALDCRAAPGRRGHAHAHAEPDGISERVTGPPVARAGVPAAGGRLPGRRRARARHHPQEPRRDRHVHLRAQSPKPRAQSPEPKAQTQSPKPNATATLEAAPTRWPPLSHRRRATLAFRARALASASVANRPTSRRRRTSAAPSLMSTL